MGDLFISFVTFTSTLVYRVIWNYAETYVYDNNKQFKIICQCCNIFVICSDKRVELLQVTFLFESVSNNPECFLFQWPVRTKIHHIYQIVLKERNGDHKYLRCTYLWYNNYEVLCIYTTFDKANLVCTDTLKSILTEMMQVLLPTKAQIFFLVYAQITVVIL